jgi:hypothetical protein
MSNQFDVDQLGNKIIDLVYEYKIPLHHFGLMLESSTPKHKNIRMTFDYYRDDTSYSEVLTTSIDYEALAARIESIIQSFDLPSNMFGLTIFVKSQDFDILAKQNPLIAERDVLGKTQKAGDKLVWFIQIIRIPDANFLNPVS